jgi:hypothetical protein
MQIHTHSSTCCRFLAHLQLIIIIMEVLCDWTRSSTPGIHRLVLLTLILGTHVCKLYSASTLVPFLSASCSWDGGSRASAQLKLNVPSISLNVPWMFEYSLNVPWMFPGAYVAGLSVAFGANYVSGVGQPALLYLVPFTLLACLVRELCVKGVNYLSGGWINGQRGELCGMGVIVCQGDELCGRVVNHVSGGWITWYEGTRIMATTYFNMCTGQIRVPSK